MYQTKGRLIGPGQTTLPASLMQFLDLILPCQSRTGAAPFTLSGFSACGRMTQSSFQQRVNLGIFFFLIQFLQGRLVLGCIPPRQHSDAQFPLGRFLGREQRRHLFPPAGTFRKHLLQLLLYQLGTVLGVGQNLLLPGILALGILRQGRLAGFPVFLCYMQIGIAAIHLQGKTPSLSSCPCKSIHRLLGSLPQILLKYGDTAPDNGVLSVGFISTVNHQSHYLKLVSQSHPRLGQALKDMLQFLLKFILFVNRGYLDRRKKITGLPQRHQSHASAKKRLIVVGPDILIQRLFPVIRTIIRGKLALQRVQRGQI